MKKSIIFVMSLILIVSLASCGRTNITMQEIADTHALTALLAEYDSVYRQNSEGGEVYASFYMTETYMYSDVSVYKMYMSEHAQYVSNKDVYYHLLTLTADGLVTPASMFAQRYSSQPFLSETCVLERIQSVTKKDGHITVNTEFDKSYAADTTLTILQGLQTLTCEYVLDAKTRHVVSAVFTSTYEDGVPYTLSSAFTYDLPAPAEAQPFIDYDKQTDDLRTITLIFHPGEAGEVTERVQSPRGVKLILEGDIRLYTDAACTIPYDGNDDLHADMTFYILAAAE